MISPETLRERLDALPRVSLAHLPTPLDDAPRLSSRAGCEILFKRDDLTGLALGGNKTRMFEFILAEALRQGADTVVAGAAAQSNYCRQLTAAAARLGLRCVLVLRTVRGEVDYDVQGNLLLDVLGGAEVTIADVDPAEQDALIEAAAERVRSEGGRPYIADTEPYLGAVAYVDCALELAGQLERRGTAAQAVYVAAAGETQAGLLLGLKALGLPTRVVGVNMGVDWWDVRARVVELANRAADRLGLDVAIEPEDVINDDSHGGDGYGAVSDEGLAALKEVAECEGIFLDPVYTSKAMAALLHDSRSGALGSGDPTVFVHTGGVPALFHYRDQLRLPAVRRAAAQTSVA